MIAPQVEALRDQLLELEISLAAKRAELEMAEASQSEVPTRAATHHIDQGGTQYSVATSTRPSSAASIGSFMDAEIA